MIQVKHIKKVAILVLMLVTTLSLVACTKKDNVPYGGLTDETYANIGDMKITNKDLYNNLRRQSDGAVNKLIEEKLLAGYLDNARALLKTKDAAEDSDAKWAQDIFDELVNQAIFQTSDVESIKEMKSEDRTLLIEKYADGLFVSNKQINLDTVKNLLADFVDTARINDEDETKDTFAKGYYKGDAYDKFLEDQFIIQLQKRIYSEEVLKTEYKDKKNDNYISDSQVVSYYKSNVKGREDANVFYFHFLSTNEANAAFREVNLKANSYGDWFQIPDIRIYENENGSTIESHPQYEYILEKLKEANVSTEKLKPSEDPEKPKHTQITNEEYKKYYDQYTPSTTRNGGDDKKTESEVLALFVKLYNSVNNDRIAVDPSSTPGNYKLNHIDSSNNIIKPFDGVKKYDELQKLNSTLASYIYSNLTEEKPYSTLRSVGTHRYLVFQLSPVKAEIDYVSPEKDEDKNEKWVTVEELKSFYVLDKDDKDLTKDEKKVKENLHKAFKSLGLLIDPNMEEHKLDNVRWDSKIDADLNLTDIMAANIKTWEAKVFKNKLTSSYANGKVSELINEEGKVEIFDPIIRSLYNQSATELAKGKNKGGDVVLKFSIKVKDFDKFQNFEITVDELYTLLENQIGLTAALDEIVNKKLIAEFKNPNGIFKDVSKDELNTKDFDKEYKTLIKNFSADQFASAGYPASIGRENFLLLMFGTTDKKQAIENGFLVPKLRTLYTSGFDVTREGFDIYDFLATYSARQYDQFSGLQVSHLLVFYDQDGDGTPDDPEKYLENLTAEEQLAHYELIRDLYEKVKEVAGSNSSLNNALTSIVEKYQEYARIPLGFSDFQDTNDADWSKFKKAGLNLKFETISSEISNTSNFITNSSTLDKVFYDRAMLLQERIQKIIDVANEDDFEEIVNDGIPFLDMGTFLNENGLSEINDTDNLLKLLANEQELYDAEGNLITDTHGIRSSFGYHFILIDQYSEKLSAEYDETKDSSNKDYQFEQDGKTYNIYNKGKQITAEQIEYYVVGNKRDESILMPSSVKSAFTKYYEPVLALFNNQFTKSALFFDYVKEIDFADASYKGIIDQLNALNKKQFHSYIGVNSGDERFDARYASLYSDWFKELNVA